MANCETKLVADTNLIRFHLEYVSLIQNPHQSYWIQKLESVPNRATRFILKNYTRTSITSLEKYLGVPRLADRRFQDLHHYTLCITIVHRRDNYCGAAAQISARIDNSQTLYLVNPRTNLSKFSPLQLVTYVWNFLPDNIVIIFIKESSSFRPSLTTFLNAQQP